ncbi:unnamed protein product, partial [Protopolystoma xenopodis]
RHGGQDCPSYLHSRARLETIRSVPPFHTITFESFRPHGPAPDWPEGEAAFVLSFNTDSACIGGSNRHTRTRKSLRLDNSSLILRPPPTSNQHHNYLIIINIILIGHNQENPCHFILLLSPAPLRHSQYPLLNQYILLLLFSPPTHPFHQKHKHFILLFTISTRPQSVQALPSNYYYNLLKLSIAFFDIRVSASSSSNWYRPSFYLLLYHHHYHHLLLIPPNPPPAPRRRSLLLRYHSQHHYHQAHSLLLHPLHL